MSKPRARESGQKCHAFPIYLLEFEKGFWQGFDHLGSLLSGPIGATASNNWCVIWISTLQNSYSTSWENLFMLYANNKGSDQPAYPLSLINMFIARCLDSIIPLVSICEISSLHLASVAAQASLCLTWLHPEDRFSHDEAQLSFACQPACLY